MRIAIVGMGLIGGSLYQASRRAGHETTALHHGDAPGRIEAEVIFVALPPDAVVPWILDHAGCFADGAVVVDVCGVKRAVCDAVRAAVHPPRRWTFVGGHPMAGREVSGYANSSPDLFRGASIIFTPDPGTAPDVLRRLEGLSRELGFAQVVFTTPEHHDEMIAYTSQLCHVVATAFVRDPRAKDVVGYSAGSYANMTRIATQDAATWSALYRADREALLGALDGLVARLGEFREALAACDDARIRFLIEEGTRAKRQEILDRKRGDENAGA